MEGNLSHSESDEKSKKSKTKAKEGDELGKLLRDLQIKLPDSANSKGGLEKQKGNSKSDSYKKPKVVQFSDSQKKRSVKERESSSTDSESDSSGDESSDLETNTSLDTLKKSKGLKSGLATKAKEKVVNP